MDTKALLHQHRAALQARVDATRAQAAPLRAQREALFAQIGELNKQAEALTAQIQSIENDEFRAVKAELANVARALGAYRLPA